MHVGHVIMTRAPLATGQVQLPVEFVLPIQLNSLIEASRGDEGCMLAIFEW